MSSSSTIAPAAKLAVSVAKAHCSDAVREVGNRGQRAEDALDALDRYLESAFLAGLPFVRIIHGKGTGRLRQVVREALQESPHVSGWENGQEKEGGEGVTVAHLHND